MTTHLHRIVLILALIIPCLGAITARAATTTSLTHTIGNSPMTSPRTIRSGDAEFTVTRWADGLNFPEGPVWVPGMGLLFSDVYGARIYHALPGGGVEPWLDAGLKTNGLTLTADGKGLYACDHGNLRLLHISIATKAVTELTTGTAFGGFVNVNDVSVGPDGRAYFTDPDFPAAGRGVPVAQARHAVYSWTPASNGTGGTVTRVAPAAEAAISAKPNGLVFSPDGGTLYVAFSGEHTVRRYSHQPDGTLRGGEIALHLDPGANPDGMTVDSKGHIWQTQYGNGRLDCYEPGGRRVYSLQIATGAVTNVIIEPGTGDRILWVTSTATPTDPGGKLWRIERTR